MFLAVIDDGLAHLGILGVLEERDGAACLFHLFEISLIVFLVRFGLLGKFVGAVSGDPGEDLLLHDTVYDLGLAAADQFGDENISAIDDDRYFFVVAPAQDGDKAIEDGFSMIIIIDVSVVDPESVDSLCPQTCDKFIDNKILPGLFGDIDPSLILPVCVFPQSVFFEAFVIGTIGGDRADTQVCVDLAAAGLES